MESLEDCLKKELDESEKYEKIIQDIITKKINEKWNIIIEN